MILTNRARSIRLVAARIREDCRHFPGPSDDTCDAGVDIESVIDRNDGTRPIQMPCVATGQFSGGSNTCEHQSFPSAADARAEADAWANRVERLPSQGRLFTGGRR